jgi:hypothetical protein
MTCWTAICCGEARCCLLGACESSRGNAFPHGDRAPNTAVADGEYPPSHIADGAAGVTGTIGEGEDEDKDDEDDDEDEDEDEVDNCGICLAYEEPSR